MATATGFDDIKGRPAHNGVGLRRAMRHSRAVRLMRRALPAFGLFLTLAYVVAVMSRSGIDTGLPPIDIGRIAPTDLKMTNPKYSGFGEDGSAYTFAAKSAQQDLLNPGVVTLEGITGELTQPDKTKTNVTAATGLYESKAGVLDLTGGIKVVSESGLSVSLPSAKLQTKEALLTSADPVVVAFPAGTINANGLTLRQQIKEITFNSEVVAHLKQAAKPAETNAAAPAANAMNMFGQSGAPLDVTAQRLDVNDLKKTATFAGNVRAVQGDSIMTTPQLTVGYGSETPPGAAATPAASGNPLAGASGKVKDIIAAGPVVMTRGTTDRVTSNQATFDAQNETGVLSGNVVLTSGSDRRATGDRVDLDQRNERVTLSGGEVVVVQGKNELRGQRLTVDRKTGRTELTAPQSGRIHATLVQESKKKPAQATSPTQDAAQAVAAKVQAAASPFAGQFKSDPSAPVKIEAARLDVDDGAKTAVFAGDVTAAQGDIVMRTPELVATYTGAAGIADVAATNPATSKAPAAQISRIQAKHKVQVTTKDGQTVDGDWADVDMKTNLITLGGNVLLKKGKTVVSNSRLVVDMNSGEIKLDTAAKSQAAKSDNAKSEPNGTPTTGAGVQNGGRPSATFFPGELKASRDKKP
jgi:lipopolysaccharide export system protein LptA